MGEGRYEVIRRLMLLLAVLAALPGLSRAESLWGMEWIGRWMEGYDAPARLAGGTAIGVVDPFQMSPVNPAGLAWASGPQASQSAEYGNGWVRAYDADGSHRRGALRLNGISAVLPGPGPLSWSAGYRDLTDGAYFVKMKGNGGWDDAAFTRTLRGSGGLGELSASAACRLAGNRASVGFRIGAAAGTLRDVTEDLYESSGYLSTRTTVRTRMENGVAWSAGFQALPVPGLALGAVYHGQIDLDMKSLFSSTTGQEWERRAAMKLPGGYGLGVSYTLAGRHRLALDWNERPWSETTFSVKAESGGSGASGFLLQDAGRIGAGYVLLPSPDTPANAPILERAVWRAGFSHGDLPVLQKDGRAVSEWAAGIGLGLPVQIDRGYFDFGVEYGRTGDVDSAGLQETFLRFHFGITYGRFTGTF